ncbi:ABC transporter ATP-binding protein [Nitratireductor aquibiodomus]|uniref:ABC transporter ATP-binding protein n=1 Tax=Nitratireductor aquibiodomus TaxID=204799 RepID=UPI00046A0763|nr:sn-glycerol-3-phosphate ABC transporter ATP-binding protein UgpC [Nitratireductor aquibiodomus]
MATVSFSKVVKKYGLAEVIHGADINIEDGEFIVFVGPSGCGKSTLLRMLAGLESISGGEIRIGDRAVNHLPPKDRDVAMVFQNYALYPHMSVADNIGFPLKMTGIAPAKRAPKVAEVASLLGLDGMLDRYPRQLSGGQRQRVAMGRAIIREPSVFLFDEPLSNLDAALRVQMRREIKLLHQRLGSTMIFVTHDQVEAMTMADRIVVLRGGRVEQIGTPDEIYRKPENTFVASFIGAPPMNVIEGTVAQLQRGPVFVPKVEPKLAIDLPASTKAQPNAAFLGIRPEDCVLQRRTDPSQLNGCIKFIERSGPETQLTIAVGATGGLSITTLSWDGKRYAIGDPANVVFPPERLCLFDQEGKLLR